MSARGEIDADLCPRLQAAVHVEPGARTPRIVLDLSHATLLDSSGINVLVAAYQAAEGAGGWLRIAAPALPVARVLRLTELDTVIDCYPTLDDALTT
ncbi:MULTISPECIES: STAS domain-containing protein [Streptomyces]|uniref:STAS domain-containing protein n=1 Tax=Streptomyces TaxID=1883 RepID=UPI001F2D39C0